MNRTDRIVEGLVDSFIVLIVVCIILALLRSTY